MILRRIPRCSKYSHFALSGTSRKPACLLLVLLVGVAACNMFSGVALSLAVAICGVSTFFVALRGILTTVRGIGTAFSAYIHMYIQRITLQLLPAAFEAFVDFPFSSPHASLSLGIFVYQVFLWRHQLHLASSGLLTALLHYCTCIAVYLLAHLSSTFLRICSRVGISQL